MFTLTDLNLRLHLAAWSGQTEVVRYLCNNKADVGAAAMDNMGAIHFASQKGHTEIIRILLSSGVSVKATNRKGFMPLHYAIQGSHLDLIKYLVRKGASLSAKTKAGKTPLDLASDEVRAFVLECELSFKNEGETKCNEELATKETVEEGEAVEHEQNDEAGHDEGEKRKIEVEEGEAVEHEHNDEPGYDEGEKRKVEAPEEDDSLPNPKKAKVVLSHLVAADDDLQEDE
ncbi:hypothetical protein QJS04_geneDACA012221 [Acorus gramineus]|uniref:Uncharacterized protein n=1 Tax=Acorus gramineus TaxID=55184 RepID=A0AAV9BB11_ACOGR|nr:hypothetical protein QJS04_geneDACA012221 [Acorus gramineus]